VRNSLHLLYRNKETGKIDPKIYNVIEDRVSLNNRFKTKHYFKGDLSTLFNEIEIVPYPEAVSPEIIQASSHHPSNPMSEHQFFDGIISTLKRFIRENWSPNKHHLIQHSSGLDSRVMSTIIHRIYEERGDEWLGDISFVAWGHEADLAKKIIVKEGWNADLFTSLPKDDNYFKHGLDPEYAWRGLNGSSSYPINNPHWAFDDLRRLGIIPNDLDRTQVWAASWFNEIFNAKLRGNNLKQGFLENYYYCTYAKFASAFEFEFVQPLFNSETIEHISRTRIKLGGTPNQVRRRLMVYVDKELDVFPRLTTNIKIIPRKYIQSTKEYYDKSWFGSKRPIPPYTELIHHPWWAAWSTAALCEQLINNGISVEE